MCLKLHNSCLALQFWSIDLFPTISAEMHALNSSIQQLESVFLRRLAMCCSITKIPSNLTTIPLFRYILGGWLLAWKAEMQEAAADLRKQQMQEKKETQSWQVKQPFPVLLPWR